MARAGPKKIARFSLGFKRAAVELSRVELHWYEAHGIGRRDFKITHYVDD